ncbi:MAG: ABC transporter permease [Planctomycetes bacterium]|nr:ABC transporter permease [Planctomycetota bacterium]
MWKYFASAWRCRHFWFSLVKNDLQLRYRRSVIGIGWSLLQPLAATVVMCAVFHAVFHLDVREHGLFILCGLACWSFLTNSTIQGCSAYVQAESYIRQHPLPLAIYPLRTTLGTLIHFLIALALVTVLTWTLKGFDDSGTWTLKGFDNLPVFWAMVPGLVLYFQFGWAVATLVGYVNVVFRDTQHFFEVGFQMLFYLTPILYPPHAVMDTPVGWLVRYNPLTPFLNMIRVPLLSGELPSLRCYAVTCAITLLTTAVAALTLRFQQRRVILYL